MAGVVVVYRKDTGKVEVYSSLKGFTEHNPDYKSETIRISLFRRKKSKKDVSFEDQMIRLVRCPIIGRIAQKKESISITGNKARL